jgi:hypothetical protein
MISGAASRRLAFSRIAANRLSFGEERKTVLRRRTQILLMEMDQCLGFKVLLALRCRVWMLMGAVLLLSEMVLVRR